MYINSERAFSILSSICPSVYLLILIVICSISFTYFFAALYEDLHETHKICGPDIHSLRNIWCYVTVFVYSVGLFTIFGAGSLVKYEKWNTVKVEYMISPQVPSVVYNILVLVMYCLYLAKRFVLERDF